MNKSKTSSRVQGLWAGSGSSSKLKTRPKITAVPTEWAGKQNVDTAQPRHTFQPISKAELKDSPQLKILRENGEHILGSTVHGTSKIYLESDFIGKSDADWMFETLLSEVQWKQQQNFKYGTSEKRLTAWFSDYAYKYSGVEQKPNKMWHPLVTALLDQLNDKYKLSFNSVLANYYRDGHDTVDWHTDGEPALGTNPPIASISFGDTRNFELREMPKDSANDFSRSQHFRVPLTHGSLLLMLGATQHDWQHSVPREYHDRSARINLTFRRMHPDL